MTQTDRIKERIRRYCRLHFKSERQPLAIAAGLSAGCVRTLFEKKWNPTADTLIRLEKLMEKRPNG